MVILIPTTTGKGSIEKLGENFHQWPLHWVMLPALLQYKPNIAPDPRIRVVRGADASQDSTYNTGISIELEER
jgi:hypothetical protein